jgi:predicted enzyme related to lactoylglutathione lyase
MNRVSFFEFTSPDTAKEKEFFKAVFGWEIQQWGDRDYWLVTTGPKEEVGIDGAIMAPPMADAPRVANTITVANLDDSIARAKAAGATVVSEKTEVPGFGWLAYIASPTGIVFGMIEPIPGGSM